MKKTIVILTVVMLLFSLLLTGCNDVPIVVEKGEQGIQGEQGKQGDAGRDIYKTEIIDGCLWITYTDDLENPVNVGAIATTLEGTDGLAYELLPDDTYSVLSTATVMSLGKIVIPSTYKGKSVTGISDYAFIGCTKLKSVTIPDSVTSIGEGAFEDCDSLTNVHISNIVSWLNINFGSATSNPLFYAENLYLNGNLVTELTIPDGVTKIGNYALSGCTSFMSVTIPDSVNSIGDNAFKGCMRLTSVTIPKSVTSIGGDAFKGCTSITSITVSKENSKYHSNGNCLIETNSKELILGCKSSVIPIDGSVTRIGNSAFSGCNGLTSITIPDSITSIDFDAFKGCTNLTGVYMNDIAKWCNISFGNAYANPLCCAKNLYLNGELVTELTIPDSVTSIRNYVFYNCTSITSVTICNGVTSIGDYAFYGCYELDKVINNSSLDIREGSSDYGYVAYYVNELGYGDLIFPSN